VIHGGRRDNAVHQLELVRQEESRQPTSPLPELDDRTVRELVALMAEAILAVVGDRTEGDDDR
jgi:hypothetical protein